MWHIISVYMCINRCTVHVSVHIHYMHMYRYMHTNMYMYLVLAFSLTSLGFQCVETVHGVKEFNIENADASTGVF